MSVETIFNQLNHRDPDYLRPIIPAQIDSAFVEEVYGVLESRGADFTRTTKKVKKSLFDPNHRQFRNLHEQRGFAIGEIFGLDNGRKILRDIPDIVPRGARIKDNHTNQPIEGRRVGVYATSLFF
ncbi:MAG: hypothetical protein HQK53_19525 [Oligoflexia bacterium]|nr:hypothetical protein [Oligoflexia bacterium]